MSPLAMHRVSAWARLGNGDGILEVHNKTNEGAYTFVADANFSGTESFDYIPTDYDR